MEDLPVTRKKINPRIIIGTSMMVLSTLIFFAIFGIPFLEISAAKKVTLTTICIVSMEILWWLGVLVLGKELWNKYKHHLNPKNWFRKQDPGKTENTDSSPENDSPEGR